MRILEKKETLSLLVAIDYPEHISELVRRFMPKEEGWMFSSETTWQSGYVELMYVRTVYPVK